MTKKIVNDKLFDELMEKYKRLDIEFVKFRNTSGLRINLMQFALLDIAKSSDGMIVDEMRKRAADALEADAKLANE